MGPVPCGMNNPSLSPPIQCLAQAGSHARSTSQVTTLSVPSFHRHYRQHNTQAHTIYSENSFSHTAWPVTYDGIYTSIHKVGRCRSSQRQRRLFHLFPFLSLPLILLSCPYQTRYSPSIYSLSSIIFYQALYEALTAICTHYLDSEALQAIVPVPTRIRALMARTASHPWQLGTYRPDILQSTSLGPLVCEINVRFPLNGYLITQYAEDTLESCISSSQQGQQARAAWSPTTRHISAALAGHFKSGEPIVFIRGREPGWDTKFLHLDPLWRHRVVTVDYHQLQSHADGSLTVPDPRDPRSRILVQQAILELHQDELLDLDDSTLDAIVSLPICLNDIRTIFVAHDKRLLAALSTSRLMQSIGVSRASCLVLAKHIVPTHVLQLCSEDMIREEFEYYRRDYILKAPLLGKGKGMVFGKDCSDTQWHDLLTGDEDYKDYIVQPCIQQEKHNVIVNDDITLEGASVVGTLLCLGPHYLGPGIFRAGTQDIVNVATARGTILTPVYQHPRTGHPDDSSKGSSKDSSRGRSSKDSSRGRSTMEIDSHVPWLTDSSIVPAAAVFVVPVPRVYRPELVGQQARGYLQALNRYGIASITFTHDDDDGNADDIVDRDTRYMHAIVSAIGEPNAHGGHNNGDIWDVKLCPDIPQEERARSQTLHAFPMHTDCCFEDQPPRYMALYCARQDRLGGGVSHLIRTQDVLSQLHDDHRQILEQDLFTFRVPVEFDKGVSSTQGRILTGPCIRYRREVIDDSGCSQEQRDALDALDALLNEPPASSKVRRVQALLADRTLLLLDNALFLHGRGPVHDAERHLKRIRFHLNPGLEIMVPWHLSGVQQG